MGFEPTTASLEGWNSTTELRPPTANLPMSTPYSDEPPGPESRCIQSSYFQSATHPRIEPGLVWWAGKGSNLGSHKAADLQSAPFVHLGTCPRDTYFQT